MGSNHSTHSRLLEWWFTAEATPAWGHADLAVRRQTVGECETPPGAPVAASPSSATDVHDVYSRAEPASKPVHAADNAISGPAENTPLSVVLPVSATPEAGDAVHPPREADKTACVLEAMLARKQQAGPSPVMPQRMGAMVAQIQARGGAEAKARPQLGGGMGAMLAQIKARGEGEPKEASQAQQTAEPVVDQAAIDAWKKRLRLNNKNRELIYACMERAGVLHLVPAVLGDFKPTQQQQQQQPHAQYEKDLVVRARRAVLAEGTAVEPWSAEMEQIMHVVKNEKATLFPVTEPKRAKQAVKAPVAAAKATPAATLFEHFTRTMAVNVVIKKLDGSGSGIIERIESFAFSRSGDNVTKLFTLLPTQAEVEVLSSIPDAEWPTYFSGLNQAERMVATMYKSPAATLCVRHMAFMASFADTLSWAKGILQGQLDMMRSLVEDGMLRRLTTLVTAVSCGLNRSDDRTPFRFLELSPQLTSVKTKDGSGLLLIDIVVKVGMQCGQGDLLSRVAKTLASPNDRVVDLRAVDEQVTSAFRQFDQFGHAIPAAPARGAVAASLGSDVLLRKASSGTTLEEDDKEGTDTDARFGRSESTGPTDADVSQPRPSAALKATGPQSLLHEAQLAHLRAFVAERTAEVEAIKALLQEAMDLKGQLYAAVYEAVPRGKPAKKEEADPLFQELFRVGPAWKAAVERHNRRCTDGAKASRAKVLKGAPVRAATGA